MLSSAKHMTVTLAHPVPRDQVEHVVTHFHHALRQSSVTRVRRDGDAIEFEAPGQLDWMRQDLFRSVARGEIVATPIADGGGYEIGAELELFWLTVLSPGLWVIFELLVARFGPSPHPSRLTLYATMLGMPIIINVMIRGHITRTWKRWLEWGVESGRILSSRDNARAARGHDP